MSQLPLFSQSNHLPKGLTYLPNFIASEHEQQLLNWIDAQPWKDDLKRRVQHYGYRYDYKAMRVKQDSYLGDLPQPLQSIAKKLFEDGFFKRVPDQAIVNEYQQGQGIAMHIDCEPCFGDTIASLSLGADVMMNFDRSETEELHKLCLERRSLVVLSEEARWQWRHGIPARKSDVYSGVRVSRRRRVSVTFRKVIL